MAIICPTITATSQAQYHQQMDAIKDFATRIHIDLMDGQLAPTLSPSLEDIWWPHHLVADVHLMYQNPMEHLKELIVKKPHLVIIHAEAKLHHMHFAAELHKADIKAGLAVLQKTQLEDILQIIHSFDHVLVFSGKLGFHGGQADLELLSKVKQIRLEHPEVEIAWDGGINLKNARQLVDAGVEVLNTGGFIHKSPSPREAYKQLTNAVL